MDVSHRGTWWLCEHCTASSPHTSFMGILSGDHSRTNHGQRIRGIPMLSRLSPHASLAENLLVTI